MVVLGGGGMFLMSEVTLHTRWTWTWSAGAHAGLAAHARRGTRPCTLHPAPFTLHPTPYTLHPTPYTLHLTPYTLQLTPHTLHPTPYTLNPMDLDAERGSARGAGSAREAKRLRHA